MNNWNTSVLFESIDKWKEEFNSIKSVISHIETYKGKLNEKKVLLEALIEQDKLENRLARLYLYASLNHDTDMADDNFVQLENQIESLFTLFSVSTSFFAPELSQLDESYIKECIYDKDFVNYNHDLYESLRSRPHTLSEKEEKLVSKIDFDGGFHEVFSILTNVNFDFNPVETKQGLKELNDYNFIDFLEDKDRDVRKMAFQNYYKTYLDHNDTIATNYIYSIKSSNFTSDIYNFKNTLERKLFNYNLEDAVYYTLIKCVNDNLPKLHKYYETCKKVSRLEDYTYYDTYVSLSNFDRKVTFDDSMKIIKKALSVFGDEYLSLLDEAVNHGWIDVYPKKNKRSGAYENCVYGVHPFVLLNYTDNIESCFTTAHELGHAMHTYLTNKHQPLPKSEYSIYLAEISSTVNEILLLKYFLNNAKNSEEELYFVDKYIKMFKGTVFRQTMFSEYEDFAHKLVETNAEISKTVLNSKYNELCKAYFGKAVSNNANIAYEWSRIPHFYTPYYVYNYATSFTAAVYIANQLLTDNKMAKRYLDFLSSGDSEYPNELLLALQVDMTSEDTYRVAFSDFEQMLNRLDTLLKNRE